MFFRKIVAVYSEKHTNLVTTMWASLLCGLTNRAEENNGHLKVQYLLHGTMQIRPGESILVYTKTWIRILTLRPRSV